MCSKTIVICVDGSGIAEGAFNYAINNIWKEGDSVLVLHVPEYNVSMGVGSDWEKVVKDVKEKDKHIDEFVFKYMDALRHKGINCKSLKPKGGKAGEVICDIARTEGASHIVMGTRGLGKLQRAFLGSVSHYVLNHSEIPVTIIPAAAAKQHMQQASQ